MEHLVHDPRIWVVLWLQRARVDYHPKRCLPQKLLFLHNGQRGIAPMVFSRVIFCQSYLQTAFYKFPLLKRPSASVSAMLDSISQVQDYRGKTVGRGLLRLSPSSVGDLVSHWYLGTACFSPSPSCHTYVYFNEDSEVVCYL